MELALLLLKKLVSLFIVLMAGWALVRTKVLKAEHGKTLSAVLVYVIVPCATVNSFLSVAGSDQLLLNMLVLLGAALIIQGGFALIGRGLRQPLRLDEVEQASITYSNAGNLILPLITSMLGPEYIVYCVPFMAMQTIFLWTHCRSLISGERGAQWKKILFNPPLMSVPLGLVLFLTGAQLPDVLSDTLSSVSGMIGPVTMLVVGMLMGGMSMKKVFSYKKLWMVVAFRLVVLPLLALVFLRFALVPFLPQETAKLLLITLLAAAAPAGATVTNLSQLYDKDADYAGTINVVTMLCCIVTMPALIALYQLF